MSPIVIPLPFGRRRRDEEAAPTEQPTEPATEPTTDGAPVPAPTPQPADDLAAAPASDRPIAEAAPAPEPLDRVTAEPEPSPPAAAPDAAWGQVRQAVPAPPPGPAMTDYLADLAAYESFVLAWIAEDGYPMNVAAEIEVSPAHRTVRFSDPVGFHVPAGAQVAITGSHVLPVRGGGFDERRHLTVWGTAVPRPRGRFLATPDRAWAWDDGGLPLPAIYERDLPKARRYYERLSTSLGFRVRPRLPGGLLLVRATRAPFLSATLVPVVLGVAVAARVGTFDLPSALLTLLAACAIHMGLNAANDVFDTMQGADDANTTPTRYSGGSRVIQNALLSVRGLSVIAVACYAAAGVLGLALLLLRGSPALVAISLVGLFISVAYTMPPIKLVYRGLGEIATAIGFGPVMLLGPYVVQSRGLVTIEGLVVSIPVGLLVALILYVNEVPDRRGDSRAGKRTLPVRWSKAAVVRGFDVVAGASFVVVIAGVVVGTLPFTTLLVGFAAPLAVLVHDGLVRFYDEPYALMPTMAANIRMHLVFGLLLLAGYLLAIVDQVALGRTPFLR